jgi:hypothetical protein
MLQQALHAPYNISMDSEIYGDLYCMNKFRVRDVEERVWVC